MALRSLQETATHHFSQFLPRRLSAFTLLGLSLHILHRLAIGLQALPSHPSTDRAWKTSQGRILSQRSSFTHFD
ncbi:hypothetical protein [Microcoleus sp. FACHB-68]|uniref:hypothetical protein n=1 Tax=Microcoleus sp. FACHB-68 TaxID=2692826 RepID=UPI001684895A|nr:hypothetical protein [Microcoleus sp. FACHB-68]